MAFNKDVFLAKEELRADFKKKLKKKAEKDHNHDSSYAIIDHNHDTRYDSRYAFSEHTHNNTSVDVGGSGGIGNYFQVTKLGVEATSSSPHIVEINAKLNRNYCMPPLEILKLDSSVNVKNITTTVCEFDNADSSSFMAEERVIFDGKMYLKSSEMLEVETLDNEADIYSVPLTNIARKLNEGEFLDLVDIDIK